MMNNNRGNGGGYQQNQYQNQGGYPQQNRGGYQNRGDMGGGMRGGAKPMGKYQSDPG